MAGRPVAPAQWNPPKPNAGATTNSTLCSSVPIKTHMSLRERTRPGLGIIEGAVSGFRFGIFSG